MSHKVKNREKVEKQKVLSGYCPVELTVNDLLLHACETNPDKMQTSFEMHKKQFTFAQMNSEAEKIGAAFLSLGELASN